MNDRKPQNIVIQINYVNDLNISQSFSGTKWAQAEFLQIDSLGIRPSQAREDTIICGYMESVERRGDVDTGAERWQIRPAVSRGIIKQLRKMDNTGWVLSWAEVTNARGI